MIFHISKSPHVFTVEQIAYDTTVMLKGLHAANKHLGESRAFSEPAWKGIFFASEV